MKTVVSALFLALAFCALGTQAQTPIADADKVAITQTALDYIEGWYAGDATRMERALHPELAKRMISTDPKTGRSQNVVPFVPKMAANFLPFDPETQIQLSLPVLGFAVVMSILTGVAPYLTSSTGLLDPSGED